MPPLSIAGDGLGSRRILSPPWALMQCFFNGQSLDVGSEAALVSNPQPFANVKLFDSTGDYTLTAPYASTLSLIPDVTPLRPLDEDGHPYPSNMTGESIETTFCSQLTALALNAHYRSFTLAATNTGQAAEPMSVIGPGGTGNAFAAGVYEAEAIQHLAPSTFGTLLAALVHGETDAGDFTTNYAALLSNYYSQLQSQFQAVTGQSRAIPLLISQQTSSPGNLTGPDLVGPAQLAVHNGTTIVCVGPKYQYDYFTDGVHLVNYMPLAEKMAQAAFVVIGGGTWNPTYPVSFSRVGNVVTMTFAAMVFPILFDSTVSAPHQTGSLAAWAAGQGFEATDATQTITGATNASPIVLTVGSTANYSNGQTALVKGVLGNTNANGAWPITVLDPTHIQLNGSVGNGTFSAGAGGATCQNLIGITSATISGDQVQLTLARSPTTDVGGACHIAYAYTADCAYGLNTGGQGGGTAWPSGRCGTLRDSDRFAGFSYGKYEATGYPNPNWCVSFFQAVS